MSVNFGLCVLSLCGFLQALCRLCVPYHQKCYVYHIITRTMCPMSSQVLGVPYHRCYVPHIITSAMCPISPQVLCSPYHHKSCVPYHHKCYVAHIVTSALCPMSSQVLCILCHHKCYVSHIITSVMCPISSQVPCGPCHHKRVPYHHKCYMPHAITSAMCIMSSQVLYVSCHHKYYVPHVTWTMKIQEFCPMSSQVFYGLWKSKCDAPLHHKCYVDYGNTKSMIHLITSVMWIMEIQNL